MVAKKISESIKYFPGEGGVTAPKGFTANGISCGLKASGRKDLCIIYTKDEAKAAAVFTCNVVKAAPLKVSKRNVNNGIHAIFCNSGNANACTGKQGMDDARLTIKLLAEEFEISPGSILIASTGIIGVPLPMDAIRYGISKIRRKLTVENNVRNATDAIMTTDTRRKMSKVTCMIGGKLVTIGAIAKGSGMIRPDMATMLAFLTTDCAIEQKLMQRALKNAVKHSFNKISVDGQMSTNDTVYLLANGRQNNPPINRTGANFSIFEEALTVLCKHLADDIVNDGEGITKVIRINVKGAASKEDADIVARTVGDSALVKTAFYGQSANWGRIIQAIGQCPVKLNPDRIHIEMNGRRVCENGMGTGITTAEGKQLLNRRTIEVDINLNMGSSSDYVITTDLTYDYVKINSNYS